MNPPDCDTSRRRMLRLATLAAAAPAALLGLAGCGGGGVEGGGTGAVPGSVASGPVSGFGSVIVDGVRYDDATAVVEDLEGNTIGRDTLRLGMTVEIDAGPITAGTATARRIRVESELAGFVSAVDVGAGQFTVLGQRIAVDANTVFDDRFAAGLASLGFGQAVEVYAEYDAAAERYRATRVEPLTLADLSGGRRPLRLRGPVAAREPGRLRIGTAWYATAGAAGAPAALAVGDWVRLQLAFDPSPAAAWAVRRFERALRDWADADGARLEGLVTLRGGGSGFVVNGRTVDGSAVALPASLVVGARVRVEGAWRGGVLRATRVEVIGELEQRERGFELNGPISAVDPGGGRFVLRGVAVTTTRPELELRDGTLADLVAGRRVEVRGVLAADRRTIEATRIRFR